MAETIRNFTEDDVLSIIDLDQLAKLRKQGCSLDIKEDETAVQIEAVRDDQVWFLFKIRDRSVDGKSWKPTKLTHWDYSKPEDELKKEKSFETSSYWGDPEYDTRSELGEDIASFVRNPFRFIPYELPHEELIQEWVAKWKQVQALPKIPFPGQFSTKTIPGMWEHISKTVPPIMGNRGYEQRMSVPTWNHVATLELKHGFDFLLPEDKVQFEELQERLPEERRTASWLTVLQFVNKLADDNGLLPENIVGKDKVFRREDNSIILYPFTLDHNLWMEQKI